MSFNKDTVISVEGLSKCYNIYANPHDRLKEFIFPRLRRLVGQTPKLYSRELWALKNISFNVKKGETVGIIGRNGSGKSTLLQMICGTLTPTQGKVLVTGRVAALLELGSGFNPEFTGRENVYLNASVLGLTRQQVDARFDAITQFAELGEFIDQPVKIYSSGMYVRLAFSVAIHTQPQILIVDEALAVGDAHFQLKCMTAIRALQAGGTSILLVTHDVSTIRQFCQSAIWLDHGVCQASGSAAQVTAAYTQFLFNPSHPVASAFDEVSYKSAVTTDQTGFGPGRFADIPEACWLPSRPPIERWGTHQGAITGCAISPVSPEGRFNIVRGYEQTQVAIRWTVPEGIRWDTFSIALAIKNQKSEEILIFTTWEEGKEWQALEPDSVQYVGFTFANILNQGDYSVVLALEDRTQADAPKYYDFFHGAQSFRVNHDRRLMGLTVTPVEIDHPALINRLPG